MYFKVNLVVVLSSGVWIFLLQLIFSVDGWNTQAVGQHYAGDIAVNCGSTGNSIALDGREWIGESASNFNSSGQSRSSAGVEKSLPGVDPVPYMTSRISYSPFHFSFQLNPGQKFIRFHFCPASYRGFGKSMDLFSVKAGSFTLLDDFSPARTSGRRGVKYLVKEFCLNVEEHGQLNITFSPSKSRKSKNHRPYAFVNGIEIVSMPTGLYYTADDDFGAPIVGQKHRFYSIDNSTALEMVQRLNIGGNFISSAEDFGMFRRWTADTDYFLESGVSLVDYVAPKRGYTNMPLLIAPPKIYQTSWKAARTIGGGYLYSFTWKIPINSGFGYLVRLHFCDLDAPVPSSEQKLFSILINNQIAETDADVIRWSGGTGFPVYKDYVVMMKKDKEGSQCHLLIVLQSFNGLALGVLKGLEIFKLSNLENSLATPDSVILEQVSTNWSLKMQIFFFFFGHSNFTGTVMTIIIFIVSTTVYCLREIWEENVHNDKGLHLASVEPSCRCFSLADIKLATQNFSYAFFIGKGGFGKVYKGSISGVPQTVAIKRLSSFSRQGAREFWTEIETLSKLRHIHLVSLIGYCNENGEMILVYEYIPGGTLADNLYKSARKGKSCDLLSWEQRLRICIGAARGLEYLHTGNETGIIHRDVKDTNILLDENFIPKISDFGLSKLEELTQSKSYVSTNIKGTRGYLDPDYCTNHRLTRKSDVYAFGVVMLVVLSGRPALDATNTGEPESLVACFRECLPKGEYDRIVDPNLHNKVSPESLAEFLKSVENCLQQQPKNRPTMAQLVGSLERVLQLQERPIASVGAVEQFELETIQSGAMSHQGSAATTFEESVESSPSKDIIKKWSGDKELNRVRKPFWVWPWKPQLHSRGFLDGIPVDKFVQFSYKELAEVTSDFSSAYKIGQGGPVYYSELRGEKVAIKKMYRDSRGEFLTELSVLAQVQHRNLVRLKGYCDDGGLYLVFEYIDNGDLNLHLHGSAGEPLSWSARLQIALDSAKALEYIHEHTLPSYIHCNIKPSEILIDTSFHAKLAGFGLTKSTGVEDDSSFTTFVTGTVGYVAPEYHLTGKASLKVDVYAFGVVLYELISAKKAATWEDSIGEYKLLVETFEEVVSVPDRNDDLRQLVDSRLGDDYPFDSVLKMAQLGRACTQENHRLRPCMTSVVSELITLSLSLPPPPESSRQLLPLSPNEMEMSGPDLILGS